MANPQGMQEFSSLETSCLSQAYEMDCSVHQFENCQELDTWIIYVAFFEVSLRKQNVFFLFHNSQ